MSSELYEDIVGEPAPSWPRTYDTCIKHACPRCSAKPFELCRNPERLVQGRGSKTPCLVRQALGEGWAHRVSHVGSAAR